VSEVSGGSLKVVPPPPPHPSELQGLIRRGGKGLLEKVEDRCTKRRDVNVDSVFNGIQTLARSPAKPILQRAFHQQNKRVLFYQVPLAVRTSELV